MSARADLAGDLAAMTGARTRLIWLHAVPGQKVAADAWDATEPDYELMGFDTADGKTRCILPGPASYAFPWIGPSGEHILYNDQPHQKVCVVNWDGTGQREITKGFGLGLWADPQSGEEWVIFSDSLADAGAIWRCRLDNPASREPVWKGPMSRRFRLSADGKRAGGEFPWPQAGVANLAAQTWRQYGRGCNVMLAPDNSYRLFALAGNHCELNLYDDGGGRPRTINVQPPGIKDPVWIPRWGNDPRFLTVKAPISGTNTDVYIGEFDPAFSRVARWLKVTAQPGINTYAFMWVDPGLGSYRGEAPCTVEIPARKAPTDASWDFGDGTAVTRGPARHTYTRAGAFTLTATAGGKTIKGWANVLPRKAPVVRSVNLLDESRVQVAFDEPMRLGEGGIRFKSGTPVRAATLSDDGLSLLIELEGRPPAGDELDLTALTDQAQEPNRLAESRVPVRRAAWPADRDGLVLLWEHEKAANFHYSASSRAFLPSALSRWGNGRFDRWGAMLLDGSGFSITDGAGGLVSECRRTGRFTLQVTLTPFNLHQGNSKEPSPIVGCAEQGRSREVTNFLLGQEGSRLSLLMRVRPVPDRDETRLQRIELGALPPEGPAHVAVVCDGTNVTGFINGEPAREPVPLAGSLGWRAPDFYEGVFFGGRSGEAYPWRGRIEAVALHSRALAPAEVRQNVAVRKSIAAGRPAIPRVEVEARVSALTRIPDPSKIVPYRTALTVNEYDVRRVLKGRLAAKTVRVAQWAIENAVPTELANVHTGEVRRLELEEMGVHPEFESEYIQDDLPVSEDPLFVDVTPRLTGEPRIARIALSPAEVWLPAGTAYTFANTQIDQYGNPIQARVAWTVKPGGEVNGGVWYGVGQYAEARGKDGDGTIDNAGVFTPARDRIGTVTVTATAADNPAVAASSVVAVGRIPGVNPAPQRPLRFGEESGGFQGDLDRVRLYRRPLSAAEAEAHAAGRDLDRADLDLVGDWTFDAVGNGAYPNIAATGLAARVIGTVAPLTEDGRTFVRLDGKGFLEPGADPRLDFTQAGTIEVWMRSRGEGAIVSKFAVEGLGWQLRLVYGGLNLLSVGMGNNLGARHPAPGEWVHVVAVMDHDMGQRLYVNGKLIGERKAGPVTF